MIQNDYFNNRKRHDLAQLEDEGSMTVQIVGDEQAGPEHLVFECWDAEKRGPRGQEPFEDGKPRTHRFLTIATLLLTRL